MSIKASEEMPDSVSVLSSNSLARLDRSARSEAEDWPKFTCSGLLAISLIHKVVQTVKLDLFALEMTLNGSTETRSTLPRSCLT